VFNQLGATYYENRFNGEAGERGEEARFTFFNQQCLTEIAKKVSLKMISSPKSFLRV
jgi:hypothetical protein